MPVVKKNLKAEMCKWHNTYRASTSDKNVALLSQTIPKPLKQNIWNIVEYIGYVGYVNLW